MRPHLIVAMKKTLFLLSLLAFSPAALAEVPSGYTEHVITDASQLGPWVNDDKSAFIIKSDVINSEHRMTGNHQYWGEPQIFQAWALTFNGISGAPYGGAVRADDALTVEGLKGLRFTGNSAVTGGALYGKGTLTVMNNESVTFSGNTASLHGGAIDGVSATISLTNNGALEFTGNSATSDGGAIASSGALCIAGNGSVTFRNNYEKADNTYRLRSVFVKGGSLNLAAGDGQDITFYDTLYVKSGATVSFNNSYTDANGSTQQATGDIVFSGKNAEHDLQALKATFTNWELENSLTTEVNATTNLYGGTLRIEDGAVYKGNGINLAENSGATLRLADGSLRQDGCNVSLAAGTTLALHGTNSITANSLDMQDGSTLSFVLGGDNAEKAALTLDGAFNQGGNLNIALQAGETFQVRDRLVLMTTASGTTPDTWDASKITLSGLETDRDRLSWENGVLYYNTRLTWSGESQLWDNRTESWMLGEYRCGNTDGVDVVFGDKGSGNVYLSGTLAPKSVLVENSKNHDYCFMRYGSLTGGMQLIKDGEGKLSIANTTNDYTGGTIIKGGTLQMGNENALGSGDVTLMGGTLNLGGCTLSNNVNVNGSAHLTNGTFSGNLILADNTSFTWEAGSFLKLTGSISLGSEAKLDLGWHTLYNNVNVNGTAHITNGTVSGNLSLADNVSFTWNDAANLQLAGNISLGNNTSFDLGGHAISNNIILNGSSAHISNGTVSRNLILADYATFTLSNATNLQLSGSISLGTRAELDLGKRAISNDIILNGSYACIGNGSINKDLDVKAGQTLILKGDIDGPGDIIIGNDATLDLRDIDISNSVILNEHADIRGSGTISGDLILADKVSFSWNGRSHYDDMQLTGSVTMGNETRFDLNGQTLSASVNVIGDNAIIRRGSLSGDLILADKVSFSWHGSRYDDGVQLTGSVTLGNEAWFDLNGQTLSASVNVIGDTAFIQGGNLAGDLTIGAGNTLDLYGDLTGTGSISLEDGAELYWKGQTLSGSIKLNRGSAIYAFFGSSRTFIETRAGADGASLEKVSVSDGLIAGTDRQASLADGLKIKSDADLMIESMTITANNEIYVGKHTITLKDVTIKLSEDYFDRENPVDGVYYFKLQDLFHCDVEFNNVVFDATDLTLPQGFDPSKVAIGLDFGNEVNIAKTDSMYLHMDGDWSQTMSLVDGKPVFTALVPTPEPTTGVLSLLSLSLLAGRRRRH